MDNVTIDYQILFNVFTLMLIVYVLFLSKAIKYLGTKSREEHNKLVETVNQQATANNYNFDQVKVMLATHTKKVQEYVCTQLAKSAMHNMIGTVLKTAKKDKPDEKTQEKRPST